MMKNGTDQAELYRRIEMKRSMSIQEVSDKTGLPKSTLRYWEKEFNGIISPGRTSGGQRRYQYHHIEIFRNIRSLKKEGKSIPEIRELFSEQGHTANTEDETHYASVEMLAHRIAGLVSEEVNRFLSMQDRKTIQKPEVAE